MANRKIQEINAGSMADIAFLLLIFFLVAMSLEKGEGIERILPDPNEEKLDDIEIAERDLLVILVNSNDDLLVEKKPLEVTQLRGFIKDYMLNVSDDPELPRKFEVTREDIKAKIEPAKSELSNAKGKKIKSLKKRLNKLELKLQTIEFYGEYAKTNCVISLQNSRATSHGMYIKVQNEIDAAYNELRNDLAMEYLKKPLVKCTPLELATLNEYYPKVVSEAEQE